MNVIVLTPDRVGSTLLQRYITVIMQGHDYGKPVVNLHELTNGLETYYNEEFKKTMVGKPHPRDENGVGTWSYHQSLDEIITMLDTTDHYKTSRMALYHIVNRKDAPEDQQKFYKYINDNFFIIAAKRLNLFEHALSWVIKTNTKRFNAYSHAEKSGLFNKLVANGIYVDAEIFTNYLSRYLKYERWLEDNFRVDSVFNYEEHIQDLDAYVSSLDIYPTKTDVTFEDVMGMDFKTWNTCHYLISDGSNISNSIPQLLSSEKNKILLEPPKQVEQNDDMERHRVLGHLTDVSERIQRTDLSLPHQEFLAENLGQYHEICLKMSDFKNRRLMVSPIPIKLNTMMEKASMVRNFKELYEAFLKWCVDEDQEHRIITPDQLDESVYNELDFWYNKK